MATGKWLGRLAIGLVAGAAGTAAMNAYWKGAQRLQRKEAAASSSGDEPATVKVARTALAKVGVRHPSRQVRNLSGQALHWGYGALWGGLASLTGELGAPLHWGGGQLLGAGIWAFGDLWLLYQMGYAKHPREYPIRVHLEALGAHLAYGAGIWAALKSMEAIAGMVREMVQERVESAQAERSHEAA